jgi:hypothetical protein
LPPVAGRCAELPDRAFASEKSGSIGDQKNQSVASVCRSLPRLGVSKGQEKGKVKSG